MPLYDADGYEVDPGSLEIGDYAYDEDGQEFYMASPEEAEELGYEVQDDFDEFEDEFDDEDENDDELVGVGKAGTAVERSARFVAGSGGTKVRGSMGPGRGTRFRAGARNAASSARSRASSAGSGARGLGESAMGNRRTRRAALGAGAAGAAGVGYASGRKVNKRQRSLGNQVLEELSKALNDGDRDEVVAKLGDMVADAQSDAATAWRVAKSLQNQQELADYVELAGQYDIPVDPNRFGQVLQRVSKALPDADLAILDRVLSAAGTDFSEVGYNGVAESDVMSQVQALAFDAVSKNDGYTPEQAVTALFEANPGAYDDYLAEQR